MGQGINLSHLGMLCRVDTRGALTYTTRKRHKLGRWAQKGRLFLPEPAPSLLLLLFFFFYMVEQGPITTFLF